MSRSDKQFNIRINPDMVERLRLSAKASGRTLTAELAHHLDKLVPAPEVVKTQIRVPADVYQRILSACKESGRSINAEMIHRMTASLPRETAPGVVSSKSPPIAPNPSAEAHFRALDKIQSDALKRDRVSPKKSTNVVSIKRKR